MPSSSVWQHDVEDFLRSLNVDIAINDRRAISPLELDIFAPKHSFAIECNGLYWHSDEFKQKTYHHAKTDAALNAGISLLHVFEDEWRDKRPIVKSMIKNRVGASSVKLAARSCTIEDIEPSLVAGFFDDNHIDGSVRASHAVALRHNGEIVGALSLRTPFHSSWKGSIEIARLAFKLDTSVAGGVSRMVHRAKSLARSLGYGCLLTYCDMRFGGSGRAYKSTGMKLHALTPPRFWWTDSKSRFDRFAIRAIAGVTTQDELAGLLGARKIWGCKNMVFVSEV
jgi:hypothetical protein